MNEQKPKFSRALKINKLLKYMYRWTRTFYYQTDEPYSPGKFLKKVDVPLRDQVEALSKSIEHLELTEKKIKKTLGICSSEEKGSDD